MCIHLKVQSRRGTSVWIYCTGQFSFIIQLSSRVEISLNFRKWFTITIQLKTHLELSTWWSFIGPINCIQYFAFFMNWNLITWSRLNFTIWLNQKDKRFCMVALSPSDAQTLFTNYLQILPNSSFISPDKIAKQAASGLNFVSLMTESLEKRIKKEIRKYWLIGTVQVSQC